jgi:hypothetical protein
MRETEGSMNAIELFHADGLRAGGYQCEKCRTVKRTKEEADQCCAPVKCAICGAQNVRQYHCNCDACDEKRSAEREVERFAKAEKVTEWEGAIYSEGHGSNGGFFANLKDFEDWLAHEEEDDGSQPVRPEYVWTCDDKQFCHLDYDHIIENATQEIYDGWDAGNLSGAKELKAAIEAFNEANQDYVYWEPNMTRAVKLPPLKAPASGVMPPMRNQDLFNHMIREHGLTLLESEMHAIERIVARTLAADRAQEAARSAPESPSSVPCGEEIERIGGAGGETPL